MRVLIGIDMMLAYAIATESTEGIDLLFDWIHKVGGVRQTDIGSVSVMTHFLKGSELKMLRGFDVIMDVPKKTPLLQVAEKAFQETTFVQESHKAILLLQLALLITGKTDYLITENAALHNISMMVGIDDKVYTTEEFIEKCSTEHRDLDALKGIKVRMVKFGTLKLFDSFFRTFIDEYQPYYYDWFAKKANDDVYIAENTDGSIVALLKLKVEDQTENYSDIRPVLAPAKRLKISSLKAEYTGQKIGERFMRIVFEQALSHHVSEIYITIFNNSPQRKRLIGLIQKWGFYLWGIKGESEEVYVRAMKKALTLPLSNCYPFVGVSQQSFIVPLHHVYATALLPATTIRMNSNDVEPFKSAIRKALIINSCPEGLNTGSMLLFYRRTHVKEDRAIFAAGVVEKVYGNISSLQDFMRRCRKRSILSNESLYACWSRKVERPIVVDFLYNYYFHTPLATEEQLLSIGIDLTAHASQTPMMIDEGLLKSLIKDTDYEKDIIVY